MNSSKCNSNGRTGNFTWVEIEYLWGIESIDDGQTITGSCTLFTAIDSMGKSITIVVDAGMHQGGDKEYERNKAVDPRILNADYLVVTHAHIDHIGKIPLLVKEGFQGKIYMSPVTKQIAIESLKDSAGVMLKEYQEAIAYNKKIGTILWEVVKISQIDSKLKANGLKKHQKQKFETQRAKAIDKYGEENLKKIQAKFPHVVVNSDIASITKTVNEPLYWLDDVLAIVDKIYTLEPWEETKLSLGNKGKVQDTPDKASMNEVLLGFHNAGHIAGSVQAEVSVRVSQILTDGGDKTIGRQNTSTTKNYLFTGDLGRQDDWNISGAPVWSVHMLDYIQLETTYAGRSHPERAQWQAELINFIENAPWKVVIPTFAVQRSQEVLLLLLSHYRDNILPLVSEKREALKKASTLDEKKKLRSEIESLSWNIVLDSPLAVKMRDIYVNSVWWDFSLLDPDVQKQVFWRTMITVMKDRRDYERLYKWDRINKRDIIISSGGMCQWGAVIPHIQANISNPLSSIAFIWYTPASTLWYDIKNKDEVAIDGEVYRKIANVKDIAWFSWHIWHDEIVDYIRDDVRQSTGCVIALTHGWENRRIIKPELEVAKKWKVKVPFVWDTIKLPF